MVYWFLVIRIPISIYLMDFSLTLRVWHFISDPQQPIWSKTGPDQNQHRNITKLKPSQLHDTLNSEMTLSLISLCGTTPSSASSSPLFTIIIKLINEQKKLDNSRLFNSLLCVCDDVFEWQNNTSFGVLFYSYFCSFFPLIFLNEKPGSSLFTVLYSFCISNTVAVFFVPLTLSESQKHAQDLIMHSTAPKELNWKRGEESEEGSSTWKRKQHVGCVIDLWWLRERSVGTWMFLNDI